MTEYAAATTNATNTITAFPEDAGAEVLIEVNDAEHTSGTAATWIDGENTVTVTVTNGAKSKVYTVTVTKT